MRVLHLIESLEFGGGEKVVVDLANAMARHQVLQAQVFVCCTRRLGALQAQLDSRVQVLCLNAGEGVKVDVIKRLAQFIRDERIDVVHVHNWSIYVEAALATYRSSPRVLLQTVHGRYMPYPPGLVSTLKVGLRHALERVLARRYRAIVPVSDSIGAYVRTDIGIAATKIRTIRNGIPRAGWSFVERAANTNSITTSPNTTSPNTTSLITIIAVGRLADIKNHALLLRAFARVTKDHPTARLQLIGDGPERANLENLARELNLTQSIEFLGFRDDVDALLAKADIYVLSSRYEGISIALLEAMRASLPIVATRVGGVAETVNDGNGAILVGDDNVDEMSSAIVRLIESRDLRLRMGRAGFELFAEHFSLETTVQAYLDLYGANVEPA